MWTHDKDGIPREFFVMCSHTFTLFSLRKTAVSIKIFWLSSRVFLCSCLTVISSIFGKNFHFPFPYLVLFILQYFPFHVVSCTYWYNRYNNMYVMNRSSSWSAMYLSCKNSCVYQRLKNVLFFYNILISKIWDKCCFMNSLYIASLTNRHQDKFCNEGIMIMLMVIHPLWKTRRVNKIKLLVIIRSENVHL